MSFDYLKPGDKVKRLLSSELIPMQMTVDRIHEGLIICKVRPGA